MFKTLTRKVRDLWLHKITTADDRFKHDRQQMVDDQLKARGIRDERVLAAMRRVGRHDFVPRDLRAQSYRDSPLPIGYDQTISQPFVVASMTESLELSPSDNVLEIGTGCGYQTAILAQLAREVYSVEILETLASQARERLARYANIFVRQGDGNSGWPAKAPFDAVIVTAGAPDIPPALIEQLKLGGRMVIPVGPRDRQSLVRIKKTAQGLERQELYPVRFVPLVGGVIGVKFQSRVDSSLKK